LGNRNPKINKRKRGHLRNPDPWACGELALSSAVTG